MVFICLKDLSESLSPPKKGEFLPPTQKAAGLPVAPPLSPAAPPLSPAVPCTGRALSAQCSLPPSVPAPSQGCESGQGQTSYRVITVTLLRPILHFSQSCVLALSRTSVSSNTNHAFSTQIFCRTSPVLSRWQAQRMRVELK